MFLFVDSFFFICEQVYFHLPVIKRETNVPSTTKPKFFPELFLTLCVTQRMQILFGVSNNRTANGGIFTCVCHVGLHGWLLSFVFLGLWVQLAQLIQRRSIQVRADSEFSLEQKGKNNWDKIVDPFQIFREELWVLVDWKMPSLLVLLPSRFWRNGV